MSYIAYTQLLAHHNPLLAHHNPQLAHNNPLLAHHNPLLAHNRQLNKDLWKTANAGRVKKRKVLMSKEVTCSGTLSSAFGATRGSVEGMSSLPGTKDMLYGIVTGLSLSE